MTTDAEIIEDMARAYRETHRVIGCTREESRICMNSNGTDCACEMKAMSAAFSVCAPAIRAQAMEEAARERDAYRLLLDACHDHLHELAAIIPGNDRAYDRTTDLMGDIRAALAPPAVAEKGESEVAVFANATSNDEEPVTISRAMLYSSIMGAARLLTHQHDTALRITREAFASIDALSATAAPAQSKGESNGDTQGKT